MVFATNGAESWTSPKDELRPSPKNHINNELKMDQTPKSKT